MIHYHGGPITPIAAACEAWRRGHAMVSFAYPDQVSLAAEISQSFALDNGAFTRWKQGRAPNWSEYQQWVTEWHRHPGFDWCLIPDVIDGDEEANDDLLRWWSQSAISVCGVPVWHLHESLDRLGRLIDIFPRVALGSSGEFADPGRDSWWDRMSKAMEIACDSQGRPKVKLHGLRMLDPTIFSHLPLSSADSTNLAQNIGIDKKWGMDAEPKWNGPYPPLSKQAKAHVLADRIEFHASASCWQRTRGQQKNWLLIG